MAKTIIKNAEGIVLLDKPLIMDSDKTTIYAYIYTSDEDELIGITNQKDLYDLHKQLRKKLGECDNPIKVKIDDTTSVRVLRFKDFVKENYPSQVAKDYDNSQVCYDNRHDEEEEE